MKKIFFMILVFSVFSINVYGQVNKKRAGNLYGDVKARKIGDVITVLINESTQTSNQSQTSTNKSNAVQSETEGGTGLLKFFPSMSLEHSQSNQYNGTGSITSRGSFTSTMSVIIKEVREDGNYLIQGSRQVETNGEKTITTLTGIVRPDDITSDNSIYSSQIADMHIYHQGKGVVEQGNRPGLFTRIINWIF